MYIYVSCTTRETNRFQRAKNLALSESIDISIQKIAIAEKYRPIYEKKARENQKGGQGGILLTQKPAEAKPISTRDELSKIAGVSHDTYNKGKKILDSDNEEVKQKVMKRSCRPIEIL